MCIISAAIRALKPQIWKECTAVYVNVDGTWKQCRQVYVNDGGTWKPCIKTIKSNTQSVSGTGSQTFNNVQVGSNIKFYASKTTGYQVNSGDEGVDYHGCEIYFKLTGCTYISVSGESWAGWKHTETSGTHKVWSDQTADTSCGAVTINFKATSATVTIQITNVRNSFTGGSYTYTTEEY